LGDLGATYDDHLRLVGKRVGDFLLVLIELFSLGRTADTLRAIIGSKSAISLQHGPVDPKFQVEDIAPTYHSFSQKTMLNYVSYGIKFWTDFYSVLSQSMRLPDRQTDRRTEFSSLDRVCIPCMQRGKKNLYIYLSSPAAPTHCFCDLPAVCIVQYSSVCYQYILVAYSFLMSPHVGTGSVESMVGFGDSNSNTPQVGFALN